MGIKACGQRGAELLHPIWAANSTWCGRSYLHGGDRSDIFMCMCIYLYVYMYWSIDIYIYMIIYICIYDSIQPNIYSHWWSLVSSRTLHLAVGCFEQLAVHMKTPRVPLQCSPVDIWLLRLDHLHSSRVGYAVIAATHIFDPLTLLLISLTGVGDIPAFGKSWFSEAKLPVKKKVEGKHQWHSFEAEYAFNCQNND